MNLHTLIWRDREVAGVAVFHPNPPQEREFDPSLSDLNHPQHGRAVPLKAERFLAPFLALWPRKTKMIHIEHSEGEIQIFQDFLRYHLRDSGEPAVCRPFQLDNLRTKVVGCWNPNRLDGQSVQFHGLLLPAESPIPHPTSRTSVLFELLDL